MKAERKKKMMICRKAKGCKFGKIEDCPHYKKHEKIIGGCGRRCGYYDFEEGTCKEL